MSKKKRKKSPAAKRRKRRKILLVFEIFVLIIMVGALYVVLKLDKLNKVDVKKENLNISETKGEKEKFTNIAMFGLDSRKGELKNGVRSDTIMVASINNKTKDVKIVSIFRDTIVEHEDGKLKKINSAYADGGPEEAIAAINKNLDLNIENFVSVDFNAVADVVDALGGIEVELTNEEIVHLNNYTVETSKVVNRKTKKIRGAGVHKLDGIQAVSYCRIRYTAGDDFKRSERQRTVIQKIADKAKSASPATLNKIVDEVFPEVYTSFSTGEILGMVADALSYNIGGSVGFPFEKEPKKFNRADSVVALGLKENVEELHQYLFDEEDYEVADKVVEISNKIAKTTGVKRTEPANDMSHYGEETEENAKSSTKTPANTKTTADSKTTVSSKKQ